MQLLLLYYSIMVACHFIASRCREHKERFWWIDLGLNIIMYVIVFIMGIRMGANEEVTANLGTIGVQSVIVTILTIAGSMGFITIMRKCMRLDKQGNAIVKLTAPEAQSNTASIAKLSEAEATADNEAVRKATAAEQAEKNKKNLQTTIFIAIDVVVAMLIGYFAVTKVFAGLMEQFDAVTSNSIIVGLCFLVGFVGLSLGLDGTVISRLRTAGIKVILVPILAILGSAFAGIIYGLISSFSLKEALAISLGFGWYTYAPGVISEAGYVVASAVSFLHNVIRETAGIIAIPVIAQKFGYLECTTVPGVASMDICMPIIERSCQPETIVYGFATGLAASVACSLFVPIVIAL